jgi:hypothetical protein
MATKMMKRYADGDVIDSEEKPAPRQPTQNRLKVTKEELDKSGLSLRDYMNKQLGLKRRDGSAPESASAPAKAPTKATMSTSEAAANNLNFDPARNSSDRLAESQYRTMKAQRESDDYGETAKVNAKLEAANKLTDKDFGSLENIQRRKAAMDTIKGIPSAIGDYVSSLGAKEEKHGTYVKDGKVVKYAKGGSVSSASSRADGCAQRGKTKGKMR